MNTVFETICSSVFTTQLNNAQKPQYSLREQEIIEEKWTEATRTNPSIYNGQTAYLSHYIFEHNICTFYIYFDHYKYLNAQNRGVNLRLTPVGTSGIIINTYEDQTSTFIGKRNCSSSIHSNRYELIPSGHIEADNNNLSENNIEDPLNTLINEFREETGISLSKIIKTSQIAVIKDTETNTLDFCYGLYTKLAPRYVIEMTSKAADYTDIIRLDIPINFTNILKFNLIPTSIGLLIASNNFLKIMSSQ